MGEGLLFPEFDTAAAAPRWGRLERISACIVSGFHPLSLALRQPIPLLGSSHCGGKPLTSAPRVSRGEGTDVRAAWPACKSYVAAREVEDPW